MLNVRIRKEIVEGKEFSQWSYNEAKKRYFADMSDDVLKGYLKQKNVTIRPDNRQWFTEAEKSDIIDYWKSHEQEFLSKIRTRWSYRGPIKEMEEEIENV